MSTSAPPESAPAPTGRTAPPGATPIEIARADPNAPILRVAGETLFRAGTVVGDRYKVELLLGRGGFGDVYRAVHVGTHEPVALKVLRPDLVAEAKAAERFTSEARLSASLKHPNTVRVFDFGQTPDGLLYLAMEFLEGKSLEEILQTEGRLPAARCVRLTVQILKSLTEAHGKRIVHRDLKPDNIFVGHLAGEDDFVRVIDFGIAKFLAEGASAVVTQAGAILGTPHYMSPEQIRGESLDARADLYSVGVLLYRCLTGRHPFDGDTTFAILAAHLQDPLPAVNTVGVGRDLEAIVAKSLSRERDQRYATADAFRQALEGWLAHVAATPSAPGQTEDKTQISLDVIGPSQLRASLEARLPASAETVVAPALSLSGETMMADHSQTAVAPLPGPVSSDTALIQGAIPLAQRGVPPRPGRAEPPRNPQPSDSKRAQGAPPSVRVSSPSSRPATPRSEMATQAMDLVLPVAPAPAPPLTQAPPTVAPAKSRGPLLLGLAVLVMLVGFGVAVWWFVLRAPPPARPAEVAAEVAVPPLVAPAAVAVPVVAVPVVAVPVVAAVAPAVAPTPVAVVAEAVAATAAATMPPTAAVAVAAPPAEHKAKHREKADKVDKPDKPTEKAAESGHGSGKYCGAPEGSKEWCTGCSKAQNLTPSSRSFCPCLVAQGQTTGLTYYCKCVFPKEEHKIGSPAFCRCNPRDPTCEHE